MKKKPSKKKYLVFLLYFILIGIALLRLNKIVENDREKEFKISTVSNSTANSNIKISVNIAKSWEDVYENGDPCVGAQYDITITNKMKLPLFNWDLIILLPDKGIIDSSWNGEYTMIDNRITFTPEADLDIAYIKPDSSEGLGFILYSDELLDIEEFILVGHKDADVTSYKEFYVLVILFVIGVIGFVTNLFLDNRISKLRLRQMQDEQIILETMQTIAKFIDAKDSYTNGHSFRVAEYSVKLAQKMKLSEEDIRKISYIALMHDCGKMGIPDNILNKPSALNEDEQAILRTHTTLGGQILNGMTALEGIKEGALYHHERYDGLGYPEGIKGNDIPLFARIICVADSYDTMNTDRCYRPHLSKDVIIREFRENAGKQFDPDIAIHIVKMLENNEI